MVIGLSSALESRGGLILYELARRNKQSHRKRLSWAVKDQPGVRNCKEAAGAPCVFLTEG